MTEGFLLLLCLIAVVRYVYWVVEMDERPRGKAVTGLFKYLPGREPPYPPELRLGIERTRDDSGKNEP